MRGSWAGRRAAASRACSPNLLRPTSWKRRSNCPCVSAGRSTSRDMGDPYQHAQEVSIVSTPHPGRVEGVNNRPECEASMPKIAPVATRCKFATSRSVAWKDDTCKILLNAKWPIQLRRLFRAAPPLRACNQLCCVILCDLLRNVKGRQYEALATRLTRGVSGKMLIRNTQLTPELTMRAASDAGIGNPRAFGPVILLGGRRMS